MAAVALLLVGCAAAHEDDAVMSDDAALTALEDQIGFDGAIGQLDQAALTSIDAQAHQLEEAGQPEAAVDAATTKNVLRGALQSDKPHVATLHPTSDIYDSDLFKLNGQEQALCKAHRIVCVRVAIAALEARYESQSQYHDGNVGGRIDCFRHTYWNAKMAAAVGADYAKNWGDAHEYGDPKNRATKKDAILSDMDLFNNDVGRKIGLVDASVDAVRSAIEKGDVRAVRFDLGDRSGKLVPSSQCSDTVHCGT